MKNLLIDILGATMDGLTETSKRMLYIQSICSHKKRENKIESLNYIELCVIKTQGHTGVPRVTTELIFKRSISLNTNRFVYN